MAYMIYIAFQNLFFYFMKQTMYNLSITVSRPVFKFQPITVSLTRRCNNRGKEKTFDWSNNIMSICHYHF